MLASRTWGCARSVQLGQAPEVGTGGGAAVVVAARWIGGSVLAVVATAGAFVVGAAVVGWG
jgi:hypothetical protein